jgi:hypothetical protein
VWEAPAGELEDLVVAAVVAEAGTTAPDDVVPAPRGRWIPSRVALGAVAAVVAAIFVAVVVIAPDDRGTAEPLAAALEGTELVPDAQGRATFTRTDSGWRIELDATGLPRLDDGRFYQAWLKDSDDLLVAIGTFNEGDDVVLWAGVSPLDYPTITVTEEAADGNPASSGRRVLVGPISDG